MLKWICLVGLLVALPGCASAPPNLSPQATTAWHQHEIQKDLDLIRDVAQEANAQVPPILSTAATRAITLWHRTAITLVHDQPSGWQQQVQDGLTALQTNLSAPDYARIARYVALAKAVLQELP